MWFVAAGFAFSAEELLAAVERTRSHRASALHPDAPTISDDLYRQAADGRVATALVPVEGHSAKKALGVGVVDVSIGSFYAAINDDQSKPLYGKLDYAEVLEGGACGERRVVFMFLPVPMLSDRWWVMEVAQNRAVMKASGGSVREMIWTSRDPVVPPASRADDYTTRGVPVAFTRGGWWLTALDANHTLVEYWTWTDVGGSVPAGLASSFAAGGVESTVSGMVDLARAGSRCPLE